MPNITPSEAHFGLARYDAMVTAIAECYQVDELKDLSDKARALEIYAKQAKNQDAELKAAQIRIRAERRCGELLRELERSPVSKGGNTGANQYGHREPVSSAITPPEKSPYAQALEAADLSRQRANRMEQLADVPADDFEAALAEPDEKPTVSGILERARSAPIVPQIDKQALWFWGRLLDFERNDYLGFYLAELLETMTPQMQADTLRLIPLMSEFFSRLEQETHEFA